MTLGCVTAWSNVSQSQQLGINAGAWHVARGGGWRRRATVISDAFTPIDGGGDDQGRSRCGSGAGVEWIDVWRAAAWSGSTCGVRRRRSDLTA